MTIPNEEKLEEIVEGAVEDAMTKWQKRQDADIVTLNDGATSAGNEVSALHARVARVEEAMALHSQEQATIKAEQVASRERQDTILKLILKQPKDIMRNLLILGVFLSAVIIIANWPIL